MELIKLFESSVVKGLLFSFYDKFGPEPKYVFPKEVSEAEAEKFKKQNIIKLTNRDYMQISIKNLSLLISDKKYSVNSDDEILKELHYGIIPYPDFKLTSLTFFHFIEVESGKPKPSAFSILVDENSRNFLYNNINRLKPLLINFLNKFDILIEKGLKANEEIADIYKNLLLKIVEIEKIPYSTLTSRKKLVIAGLDNSGKTSFLLAVNKKFSKLIGLKPTVGAEVKSIEALGSTIFLWDLGGQENLRTRYLNKSQIYLYDTDLLYYFIDIRDKERFKESLEYLQNIKINLKQFNQRTPIIYVLSKGDPDVISSEEIIENVNIIKSKLHEISSEENLEIYITSVFSIFSILRAFSSGISKLSPNRDLINLNLRNLSKRANVSLSLLLNNEGLVLADFYSNEALDLTNLQNTAEITEPGIPKLESLRYIFETSAPEFSILYKIFSKFKTLKRNEAIFKIDSSVILFKKIQIADYILFILFLMDDEIKKNKINQLLSDFLYRTSDLLLRYIA